MQLLRLRLVNFRQHADTDHRQHDREQPHPVDPGVEHLATG